MQYSGRGFVKTAIKMILNIVTSVSSEAEISHHSEAPEFIPRF
jgi:hypothetical protein